METKLKRTTRSSSKSRRRHSTARQSRVRGTGPSRLTRRRCQMNNRGKPRAMLTLNRLRVTIACLESNADVKSNSKASQLRWARRTMRHIHRRTPRPALNRLGRMNEHREIQVKVQTSCSANWQTGYRTTRIYPACSTQPRSLQLHSWQARRLRIYKMKLTNWNRKALLYRIMI